MINLQFKNRKIAIEPFIPSEKHLEAIRGKVFAKLHGKLPEKEWVKVERFINELSAGRYFDILKITREAGMQSTMASTMWRTLIVTGVIKRKEFAFVKPCLVHESELEVALKLFSELCSIGRGWNATLQFLQECAQPEKSELEMLRDGNLDSTADSTATAADGASVNAAGVIETAVASEAIA